MDMSHLEASVRRESGIGVLDLRGEINGSGREALDSMQYPEYKTIWTALPRHPERRHKRSALPKGDSERAQLAVGSLERG
jgi:hypothetical protein